MSISEIHYHDPLDTDLNDFIEIRNDGEANVALTGWCVRGVDFCFDEVTVLPAGGFHVVHGSSFDGALSDSGELIELVDAQGNVRDEVRYGTEGSWPETADGRGYSLHRVEGATGADGPAAWEAAEPTPGSARVPRGEMRPRSDATLVINEVHYHPINDDPAAEFVEILNASASSVDVAGWCLPDAAMCVREGVLAPGAMVVLRADSGLGRLGNGSQTFRLVNPSKVVVDAVRWDDSGEWPALADGGGRSLQRRDPRLSGIEPGNWVSGEPSPGAVNEEAGDGFLPTFHRVSHTRSPTSTQPTLVRASLRDGETATLVYRIGFGRERRLAMTRSVSGSWSGEIPPQRPGALVRYRLEARTSRGIGAWPREGDGKRYEGTVVRKAAESALPELMWFIPDTQYQRAYADNEEFRDNGYPLVLAHDGVVMDNAKIRVKGQQSRSNYKRKWKVVLPAGHAWDMGGLLPNPVNEFSLHSAVTDKSFMREILTSQLQALAGGIGQQVFPVRLSKNGEFYGLYLYVEHPDGVWRNKHGFSSETRVFKAERQATLLPSHNDLAKSEFDLRYQQRTLRYTDTHDAVRSLIRSLADPDLGKLEAFAYRHVDIPQVVNAIATMKLAQHLEWAHKNHHLLYDPVDEKWRVVPVDFDLNFGRRFAPGCNALCEDVFVATFPEYFSSNKLGRLFFRIPALREMLDRRTRTLADVFYEPGGIENRIRGAAAIIAADAALDRKRWYTYGIQHTVEEGQRTLVRDFVVPARAMFLESTVSGLPPSQSIDITYAVRRGQDGTVTLTGTGAEAVDLSGAVVPGLRGRIPSGTVLLPGQEMILGNERVPTPGSDRRLRVWVPDTHVNLFNLQRVIAGIRR